MTTPGEAGRRDGNGTGLDELARDELALDELGRDELAEEQILHVIVGHGLPELYANTIESFRAVCPESQLLIVDNASPQAWLRRDLVRRADAEPATTVVLRTGNEPDDPKVGALHSAYRLAFSLARRRGVRYVHLIQGDMQQLWWDADARAMLADLYRRHPRCVNVHTRAFSRDRTLMGDLAVDPGSGDVVIPAYGLTDTGVFHLERFDRAALTFTGSEETTAAAALERGLETVVSPWPTEIPVPWPAVVRGGRQVGREVRRRRTGRPFLCRPLDADQVARVKQATAPVPWEELCVPWGWSCLAPLSETDVTRWYYLNYRRHDLRRHGWRRGHPSWVTAGLERRVDLVLAPHRPSVLALLARPLPSLGTEVAARLRRRGPRDAPGTAPSYDRLDATSVR